MNVTLLLENLGFNKAGDFPYILGESQFSLLPHKIYI